MHTRRILLAFSLAASAASVAFADLVELNPNSNNVSEDRIEQLTNTLAQGSYAESDDTDIPALSTTYSFKPQTFYYIYCRKKEFDNTKICYLKADDIYVFLINGRYSRCWFKPLSKIKSRFKN